MENNRKIYILLKQLSIKMKQKVQMSLEEEYTKQLDKILEIHHITRSKFVDSLIRNSVFVLENIKDNPRYYIVEKILTDFYRLGLIDYHQLVKVLGPQRSFEINQILRTSRRFKEWRKT